MTGPDLPPGVEPGPDGGWTLTAGHPCPEGWEWQYPNGDWGSANRTVPASFLRDVRVRPVAPTTPTDPSPLPRSERSAPPPETGPMGDPTPGLTYAAGLLAEVDVRTSPDHHHWTGEFRLSCSDPLLVRALAAEVRHLLATVEARDAEVADLTARLDAAHNLLAGLADEAESTHYEMDDGLCAVCDEQHPCSDLTLIRDATGDGT